VLVTADDEATEKSLGSSPTPVECRRQPSAGPILLWEESSPVSQTRSRA